MVLLISFVTRCESDADKSFGGETDGSCHGDNKREKFSLGQTATPPPPCRLRSRPCLSSRCKAWLAPQPGVSSSARVALGSDAGAKASMLKRDSHDSEETCGPPRKCEEGRSGLASPVILQ